MRESEQRVDWCGCSPLFPIAGSGQWDRTRLPGFISPVGNHRHPQVPVPTLLTTPDSLGVPEGE